LHEARPVHTGLEGRIADLILPGLESMGFELVRVAIMGSKRLTLQIMVDRADQAQLAVEDCEQVSHFVSAVLDVEDPIEGAWTLEVSSAGIDRPLTRIKDWNRFAGHLAKVETVMPVADGRKRLTGIILGADAEMARLKLDTGETVALGLADIRRARLVLTDALIKATEAPPQPAN
jgi:ribosome maturation factor RimP